MKIARTLLAIAVGGTLVACGNTTPPEGCVDTAPKKLAGVVNSKQVGYKNDKGVVVDDKPALVAPNGAECWFLQIDEDATHKLWSVYVSGSTYKMLDEGDRFQRDLTK